MPKAKRQRKSSDVPGAHFGHALQNVVFLLQLLEADEDTTVSLEYLDDVSTQTKATTTAIQVKSNQTNPISDRAEPFWKTFSNWVDASNEGLLNREQTVFLLYLSKKWSGTIADS